jgi:hypothetical protein
VDTLNLHLTDIFFIPVANRDFQAPPDGVGPVENHGEARQAHILDETAVLVFERHRQIGIAGRHAIFFASSRRNGVANGLHTEQEGRPTT